MSKLFPDKNNKSSAKAADANSKIVFAPSVVGGADKAYTVVFEKKATYKKPSFAR
jgi:hypothetical protein